MLSLSQLLQLRLKLVSSEMPLGGVMEQSPPLGGIAVGVIAVGVIAVEVIAVGVIAVEKSYHYYQSQSLHLIEH